MFDIPTVLIGCLVFLLVTCLLSLREQPGIPPGPRFWPVVGNLLDMTGQFRQRKHKYFEILNKEFGSIFRFYFGSQLCVVLNDFESIHEAFVKKKDSFTGRPTEQLRGVKRSVIKGAGIVWANGEAWKTLRRMALQSLRDLGVGKSNLEEKIKEEANYVLEHLSKHENTPFTIRDIFLKATTNIISILCFGERYDYENKELKDIITVVEAGFKSEGPLSPIHEFPSLSYLPGISAKLTVVQQVINELSELLGRKIAEHKDSYNENSIRDFIDIIESNKDNSDNTNFTQENLTRACLDLFLAGSDTTSNTLDWASLYMILNPDIQRRCQEEIDNVVGSSLPVCWADKSKMPYVEATLLEVQRMGNTAPYSVPHLAVEDATVKGYLIPKGSIIYANLYACHFDPNHWKDALVFNPERFLDADGKLMKNIPAFVPFSIGPRICPGEILARIELFIFFTTLLQRYNLTKVDDSELSTEGVAGITMAPTPYKLKVRARV